MGSYRNLAVPPLSMSIKLFIELPSYRWALYLSVFSLAEVRENLSAFFLFLNQKVL